MRTAFIDADILAYKAAIIAEEDFGFGGVCVDEQKCRDKCDTQIAEIRDAVKAERIVICLSDPTVNWRKQYWPDYKANRSDTKKPELLALAKAYMADAYQSFIRPRLEADDIMGILSTSEKFFPGERIVVSEDKDLRTIPGKLYDPKRSSMGIIEISELDADRFHMYQTITGDPVDGFPGAKGAGPAAAADILFEDRAHLWDAVLFEYQSRGQTEDDAILNARLAHILRAPDYNHKTGKLKLWSPLWLVRSD